MLELYISNNLKDLWVEKNKEMGTPLSIWYARYKVAREREILMEVSNKEMVKNLRFNKFNQNTFIIFLF